MKPRIPLILIWIVLWGVAPLALLRMLYAIFTAPEKAWIIALAFDDLGNVATNGALGQSISSRAAHARPKLWARLMCWVLNRLDPGHCNRAMTSTDQNLEK